MIGILTGIGDIIPTKEDFINKIFPNGWAPLLVQLFCTGIIVFVCAKFLFKPIRNILQKRADFVVNELNEAAEKNKSAEELLTQAKEDVITSKQTAKKLIEEARLDSTKVKEEILLKADEEVKEKKIKALKEIEQEKQKAVEEVHKEIVNVALAASKKVLNREINVKDNERLVEDFIKDVVN